jgi:hypothetical protein
MIRKSGYRFSEKIMRNQKKSSPGLGHLSIQAWRPRCLN